VAGCRNDVSVRDLKRHMQSRERRVTEAPHAERTNVRQ
jgi:hypothetical protein